LIDIPGVTVKLVRPQDMPLQVANNKFDMAITGLDWVKEHLYQFPSSPVTPLVDLKYSRVRIVAALHNDLNIDDSAGLRRMAVEKGLRVRWLRSMSGSQISTPAITIWECIEWCPPGALPRPSCRMTPTF
jgi:hypothetical protein